MPKGIASMLFLLLLTSFLHSDWLEKHTTLVDSIQANTDILEDRLQKLSIQDTNLSQQDILSYLLLSGYLPELDSTQVRENLHQALQLSVAEKNPEAQTLARWEMAKFERSQQNTSQAQSLYQEAIRMARATLPSHHIALLHLEIASFYEEQNMMRAASREAMEAALEIDTLADRDLMIEAYMKLGEYFDRQGMIINSLEYFEKAHALSKEVSDPVLTAELAIQIGNGYQRKAKYDMALKTYFEAIDSFSRANRKDKLAIVYDQVASIYRKLGEISKAIEYMTNAQIINISLQNWALVGDNYQNLGLLYTDLKQSQTALTYLKKALATYQQVDNKEGIATTSSKIGLTLSGMGEYGEAIQYSEESIKVAREAGLTNQITSLLIDLSQVLATAGNNAEAISALSEASVVLRESGGNREFQLQIEKNIAELKERQGDIHNAIAHYRQAMDLQDKMYDDLSHQKLSEMEVLLESFQKEKEIEKLENDLTAQRIQAKHDKFYYQTQLELENLKSRNQQIVMLSMAVMVIGAISFLWYILVRFRKEKALHSKISEQHFALTDAYSQLERAQHELIEFERLKSMSAMAVTMNHEINQPLMIIQGNLDMLNIYLEKHDLDSELTRFTQRIQESLQRIMGIMERIENLERVQYGDYTEGTSMVDLDCASTDDFAELDEC